MKRQTLVIAGLALLSTNAFASKARVEALGQDAAHGSEYISDSRNVFRNPAVLNDTKNYLVTEWGTAASSDSATAPRAEGGFFREAGSFAYGLYLGNSNGLDTTNRNGTNFLNQVNAMDLFFAGDMGVKWGAKLHFASSKDETGTFEKKNSAFGLGLGAVMGAAEAYIDLTLSDKSTGATASASHEWKQKPSFLLGGSYAWEGTTFFANYASSKYEVKTTSTATTKGSAINVGAGRTMEINPTARIYTDVTLKLATDEVAAGKTKTTKLPVTLGVEAEATSWLTLRGSVSQNVILNDTKNTAGKKSSTANSTDVNAGATLNFGKLKVDGVIGTTDSNRAATTAAEKGVLATDNLLTRVGVTYMF